MAALTTPGNSQGPVRERVIILRMSPEQATRAEQVARQLQPSGSQPNGPPQPSASPPQFNAPGTPPTVQKLPRSRFVVDAQNQQVIALVNIDPYTIMQELGVIGNQNDPLLYSSSDTALVTNFMSDDMSDFSPIYHDENGYYSEQPVLGHVHWQPQNTISDINEFLNSQVLGGAQRSIAFYSEPLRF